MKKITIIFLFLGIKAFSFAQQPSFEGFILDKNSNDSIAFANIQLFNHLDTLMALTDFSGKFFFTNLQKGLYNIQINTAGYNQIDTLITLESSSKIVYKLTPDTTVGIIYLSPNNKKGAMVDIQNNSLKVFLPGGVFGVPTFASDTIFEKKYNIKLIHLGCVRTSGDNFAEYNQTIFEYLDKKQGETWRKEIRQDVIGLNK